MVEYRDDFFYSYFLVTIILNNVLIGIIGFYALII